MANAPIDNNSVRGMLAVLNSDGTTTVPIRANPTTHGLKINNGAGGSDNGPTDAKRDGNFEPNLMALSSDDDGMPVALYVDSDGILQVDNG